MSRSRSSFFFPISFSPSFFPLKDSLVHRRDPGATCDAADVLPLVRGDRDLFFREGKERGRRFFSKGGRDGERERRRKQGDGGEGREQQPSLTFGIGPFISQTCPGFSAHSALLIFPPS